ncbi:MAG: precorrin-8X methylmutase [Pseudomonadota bacterium]
MTDYLKDPAAIYAKSFATIRTEVDLTSLPVGIAAMAERAIHACGMVDLAEDLAYSDDVARAAAAALSDGRPILTDCEMVRAGIIRSLLPAENDVLCMLNDDRVPGLARDLRTTRSAAQVGLWEEFVEGSVILIGNAPTALFALLEALDKGMAKPAAILAMPVGFVGAAEAKAALREDPRGVPFFTLLGRRGGSAIACATLNAASQIALERRVA